MKKYILYLLFITGIIPIEGFSQLCGEGTLTFNIHALNNTENQEFNYEILPVSQELLENNFYNKVAGEDAARRTELMHEAWRTGIEISFGLAVDIIDTQNVTLIKQLNKCLDRSGLQTKGKVKSSLQFQTRENLSLPLVLKISHNKKYIYILGYYFSGCDREVFLQWSNSGIKLDSTAK